MAEIADAVVEAVEKSKESRLNAYIAVFVALTATFMALCNVKGGNVTQNMSKVQAQSVDQWSYYQSKSTKQNLAEAMVDSLQATREGLPDGNRGVVDKTADYQLKAKKYEVEKEEIKKKAEGYEKEYELLNVKDDQFDMAEACLSIGIALFGITALTQKRWLFGLAFAMGGFGFLMGLSGFVGWNLHPEWLAKILG